ncbi:MAG: FAD-binding oxidoreductase [Anaerolineales bacterium]|nr:FAD-binding oxidoreductase [Anaerolineales bacterium]
MSLPKTASVVIIGGGVMGASAAYHLAQSGIKDVVLLEKDEFFGQGATGRCAGGVRYQFGTEVNIRLSLASLPMLERFPEEIGQEVDYRKCGYLFLLTNDADIAVFEKNVALQNSLGVDTQWLSGDEIRARLPQMNLDDVLKGTFNAADGLCDPNSVVMGYINAATKLGATCLGNIEVTGMQVESGAITGVHTNQGSIAAPLVLNAAGPWAAPIGKLAGVDIPIIPVRRQIVTTTPLPGIPADFPFVIDFAKSLYFHREGEGLLTGMSNPDQVPGFDQNVDPEWELVHMENGVARLPLLEQAGLASHWAGLYEVTPDAHPIFGATPVQGFYLVGGFSGHGFMHGPIAGKLMTEIMLDGAASSVDVSALTLDRFSSESLKEYNVI